MKVNSSKFKKMFAAKKNLGNIHAVIQVDHVQGKTMQDV